MMHHVARAVQVLPLIVRMDEPELTKTKVELLRIFAVLALQWTQHVVVPHELNTLLSRIKRRYPAIADFSNEILHGNFHFNSRE